ncbi:MAG TPA: hypothetical protein VEP89_02025 [Draconibacterium sp.]|nr:hypothetical protein [Draconibacterium sp.]
MNRQITQEETDQLFQFCRRHYVHHYDIQIELVDHLASAIEEQWEQNPELSFDEGLKNSFKKFGIYGFSKIKKQKGKELRRKYNRMLWDFLLEFYRWPKVITTFAGTLGIFLLLQLLNQTMWFVGGYVLILLLVTVLFHHFVFKKMKLKIIPGKSFLLADHLENSTQVYIGLAQLPNIVYQAFNISGVKVIENNFILLAISFSLVLVTVLLYGQLFYIPKKIKEHF